MISKVIRKIYGSSIPVINIDGLINNVMTQKVEHKLNKLSVANSEALAVSINSCGGLPVQSEIIGRKLRTFARQNNLKLYTFARQMVTSGGYLILAHGDEVYCDFSSLIGKIGVSVQKYDLKGGLQYLSLEQKRLRSNDNIFGQKLNPFHELNDLQTKRIKQVCETMHNQLTSQIRQLRGNKIKQDKVFDGSLFTGKQSKQLGLVDGVGSMIDILEKKYPGCKLGIDKQRSIVNTLLKNY